MSIDFPYKFNEKNEPILLVPNINKTKIKGTADMIRVEFEQSACHLDQANEFGINLPDNFNMTHYKSLNRFGKIQYAKKMVTRDVIICYQNEIVKSLSPVFNSNTFSYAGMAGQKQIFTQLIIEKQ